MAYHSDKQGPTPRPPGNGRSSRQKALLLCLVLAGGAGIGLFAYAQFRAEPKRFAAVEPGVLYRSAQPDVSQIKRLRDDHGMKTILIVRAGESRRVPDEMEGARALGLNVVHVEIDSRREVTDEEVRQFFATVDDPANHPVLVHCSAGRHRTGYLCALYRIERQGWTVERAAEEMRSFGGFDEDPLHVLEQQLRRYPSMGDAAPVENESGAATGS